jgi:ssDNA-binding Zn-finger/Zn-ribbon topoisomerase 1
VNGKVVYPTERGFVYIKTEHIYKEISKMESSMTKMLILSCQMAQDIEEMSKIHKFKEKESFKKATTTNRIMSIQECGKMVSLMAKGKNNTEMEVNIMELLMMESSIALINKKQYNKKGSTSRIMDNYPINQFIKQQTVKSTKDSLRMALCMALENIIKLQMVLDTVENSNKDRKKVRHNSIQAVVF